ncbi:MAG: AAA family ATPase [Oligoflexia bacterium]|nr:AAA family ATPase [Oligoflexia bacterium]
MKAQKLLILLITVFSINALAILEPPVRRFVYKFPNENKLVSVPGYGVYFLPRSAPTNAVPLDPSALIVHGKILRVAVNEQVESQLLFDSWIASKIVSNQVSEISNYQALAIKQRGTFVFFQVGDELHFVNQNGNHVTLPISQATYPHEIVGGHKVGMKTHVEYKQVGNVSYKIISIVAGKNQSDVFLVRDDGASIQLGTVKSIKSPKSTIIPLGTLKITDGKKSVTTSEGLSVEGLAEVFNLDAWNPQKHVPSQVGYTKSELDERKSEIQKTFKDAGVVQRPQDVLPLEESMDVGSEKPTDDPKDPYIKTEDNKWIKSSVIINESFINLSKEISTSNKIFDIYEPQEIQALRSVLLYKQAGSAIVIGEPGSGKTELVRSFIKMVLDGKFPEISKDTKFIQINATDFDAGSKWKGVTELRVKALIAYAKVNDVIFIFDDMHSLRGGGTHSGQANDFFAQISAELANGKVRFIGTTNHDGFKKSLAGDRSLNRRMRQIIKKEIPQEKMLEALHMWAEKVGYQPLSNELNQHVIYVAGEIDAIGTVLERASRHLEAVYAYAQLESVPVNQITKKYIETIATKVKQVNADEFDPQFRINKVKTTRENLDHYVKNYTDVKDAVIDDLILALTGSQDASKPRGRRMFVGPKGVAKTWFATHMTDGFVRINMSEYGAGKTSDDLLNTIYEAVLKNPYAHLFFDEIEKAHTSVQNTLLTMMDSDHFYTKASLDGSQSRVNQVSVRVDIRRVTITFASNAGQKFINDWIKKSQPSTQSTIGFSAANKKTKELVDKEIALPTEGQIRKAVIEEGVSEFLVDRMTGVHAFFPPKNTKEVRDILELKLNLLIESQAKAKGIKFLVADAKSLLSKFAAKYFSEQISLRVLIDNFEREVRLDIAKRILPHVGGALPSCITLLDAASRP